MWSGGKKKFRQTHNEHSTFYHAQRISSYACFQTPCEKKNSLYVFKKIHDKINFYHSKRRTHCISIKYSTSDVNPNLK